MFDSSRQLWIMNLSNGRANSRAVTMVPLPSVRNCFKSLVFVSVVNIEL